MTIGPIHSKTDAARTFAASTDLWIFHAGPANWVVNYPVNDVVSVGTDTEIFIGDHELEVGDTAIVSGVAGPVGLNGSTNTITAVTANSITIAVDSSAMAAYDYGGAVEGRHQNLTPSATAPLLKQSMTGAKKLSGNDLRPIIKRRNWANLTFYDQYEPNDPDQDAVDFTVYVDGTIYLCLVAGPGPSSYPPYILNVGETLTYADGYTWMKLYDVPAYDQATFLDSEWVPVRDVTLETVQSKSVLGVSVLTPGQNHNHSDVVDITGDGHDATAIISRFDVNRGIMSVEITNPGFDYTWATAHVPRALGTDRAHLKVHLASDLHDGRLLDILKAKAVMIVAEHVGDEAGRLYVGDTERAFGLMRLTGASSEVLDFRSKATVDVDAQNFAIGSRVTGQLSDARGVVAGARRDQLLLSDIAGRDFVVGEIVQSLSFSAVIKSLTHSNRELLKTSEIICVDSLVTPVSRNASQIDQYQLIVEF